MRPLPDEFNHSNLRIESEDVDEVVYQLANFIHKSDKIEQFMNESMAETKILGAFYLKCEKDGSIIISFKRMGDFKLIEKRIT